MKKLIIIGLVIASLFIAAETDTRKVWYQFEGCTNNANGADACYFFMEDRETHTRCYAMRALNHDGVAMDCVKL